MYKWVLQIPLICVLLAWGHISAVTVGSDTAVSRVSVSQLFPQGEDNKITGFISLEGGIELEGHTVTCTFDGLMQLTGTIQMHGGTLELEQDFVLHNLTCFDSIGDINGNGHALVLPAHKRQFLLPISIKAISIELIDEIDVTSDANSIDWDVTGSYIVVATDVDIAESLRVFFFDGTQLTFTAGSSAITNVNAVRWHPTEHFFAASIDSTVLPPEDLFIFQFFPATASLIQTHSRFLTGDGPALAWHPTGNFLAATSTDVLQEVRIYTFDTATGELGPGGYPGGASPATGALIFDNLVPSRDVQDNAIAWDSTGTFLAVGITNDATAGVAELHVYAFDTTPTSFVLTTSIDFGASVSSVDWRPSSTLLLVGLGTGVTERLRLYDFNPVARTLTELTSARIGENDQQVFAAPWRSDGEAIAIGTATGENAEIRVFAFDASDNTFAFCDGRALPLAVNDARWSRDGRFFAIGDENSMLSVYKIIGRDTIFDCLKVCLNSDVLLRVPITFTDICRIDGRGHDLVLDTGAALKVGAGGTLHCQEVTLRSVNGNKIACLDTSGTITLQNVRLVLDGDFTFTQGSIVVKEDVVLRGEHVFTYQSAQQSQIASNGTLFLDRGLTFSYDPSSASDSLLAFADETARMKLNSATLHTTTTGLRLTKGKFIVDGHSFLSGEVASVTGAIQFGDGTSAGNIDLLVLPEAVLEVVGGVVSYRNTS